MKSFLQNNDVHVQIDFKTEEGEPVDVASAEYEVTDDEDQVLQTGTVSEFSSPLQLTVNAENNALSDSAGASVRAVSLIMTGVDGNTYRNTVYYFVVREQRLQPFSNSFMSFNKALSLIPRLTKINFNGNRGELITALMESYDMITRFPLNKGIFGHSVPSLVDWKVVPDVVIDDFRKAQLIQASILLQEDPNEELRESGVFSKTVGESSTTFFRSKPVDNMIHKRAWRYIARYIDNSVVVTR